MSRRKGTKPEQYAGPFQHYQDIPSRYQLGTYTGQYTGTDTWSKYCAEVLFVEHDSQYMRDRAGRAGDSWLTHTEERGRHHALAKPTDVLSWCEQLLSGDRTRVTCYKSYFIHIYRFYDYLKHHHRHPHVYNPLLIAAIEHDTVRDIWQYRIDARPEVVSRDE